MLIRPAEMDAFRLNFSNASEKEAAIQEFKRTSTFITSLTPQATDPLLALVTCTYDFPGARFLVLGRLVQIYP